MEIIDEVLSDISLEYPLENIAPLNEILFIDIETTGFSARTANLYLIGCLYYDNGWKTKQFFAQTYSEEQEILNEFFSFAKEFKTLIHYNGNNFDIPFILGKCKEHSLEYNFDGFNGIDIYRRISPYKTFLKLESCKQKVVEAFLEIKREDEFTGGDLIGLYHEYVKTKDPDLRKFLLLHNFEDVKGMLELLPILAYCNLFSSKLTVTKVSANYYEDESGASNSEIIMLFEYPVKIKKPVSFLYDKCYISLSDNQGMLKVPLYDEEMRYFYANYKDYYYLPAEDIALHKSVSSFVSKENREQAKAENCYTRKHSKFLPEWDALVTPFFKRNYSSKELFFELTDERRTDRELFSQYASHVLEHMVI
ncbi:MAG: ribonuclease H-like domain-containing protein [Lachnospiraceae bacterium]|nr:ribonuclease H-like domain-containing protein [Lachnospiraceae bacterium]